MRRPELVRSVTVLGSSGEVEGKLAAFDPLVVAMSEHGAAPVIDTLMWIMLGDETLASPGAAFAAPRGRPLTQGCPAAEGPGDDAVGASWLTVLNLRITPAGADERTGHRAVLAVGDAQPTDADSARARSACVR